MDLTNQISEEQAKDWQLGLYEDIMQTWQTPVVNWILRSLMANYPEFLRYAWGQVKPVFMTQGFTDMESGYHQTMTLPLIEEFKIEPILDQQPPNVQKELAGQLTTFASVAPGLYTWFELVLRGLQDSPMGQDFDSSYSSAAPAPRTGIKGLPPVMLKADDFSEEMAAFCAGVSGAHNLGGKLATIHLCLAQWPGFFQEAWRQLEPILETDTYQNAKASALKTITDFVDRIPYHPQLGPEVLAKLGFSSEAIDDIRETFQHSMSGGPASEVIPTLSVYAYLGGVTME